MALLLVDIRIGGGPRPTVIYLPAEALLTSPWTVFLAHEFTLFFNSSQPKYFPKPLMVVLACYFYLAPNVINIGIDTLLYN